MSPIFCGCVSEIGLLRDGSCWSHVAQNLKVEMIYLSLLSKMDIRSILTRLRSPIICKIRESIRKKMWTDSNRLHSDLHVGWQAAPEGTVDACKELSFGVRQSTRFLFKVTIEIAEFNARTCVLPSEFNLCSSNCLVFGNLRLSRLLADLKASHGWPTAPVDEGFA